MDAMKAKDLNLKKNKVEFLYNDMTIGEALHKIGKKGFQMIPVLERESSRYLYSMSSGDLLRRVLEDSDIAKTMTAPLSSVGVSRLYAACFGDTEISELIDLIANQNYVPITDEKGVFEGIVTRKSVIYYLESELEKTKEN